MGSQTTRPNAFHQLFVCDGKAWTFILTRTLRPTATPLYIYIYTWTVLEPHSFRSLWIFRCRPKNHLWAKSDGFNDTVLVSKSWSFASFLRHFASYFWSFQIWLTEGKISICSIFGRSLLFSSTKKNAVFGCFVYLFIYLHFMYVRVNKYKYIYIQI